MGCAGSRPADSEVRAPSQPNAHSGDVTLHGSCLARGPTQSARPRDRGARSQVLEVAKSTDDAAVKKMQELLRAGANIKAKEPEVRSAHSIRCAAVSGRHGRAAVQRQGDGGATRGPAHGQAQCQCAGTTSEAAV